MIKIYNNKINHQLKNKNLFKIVITLKKAKIIIIKKKDMQFISYQEKNYYKQLTN